VGAQVKTGGKWIDTLHNAYAEVTRVRERKIAASEQQVRAELELSRERESAAKKRLEEATLQLRRLEQETADPDPGPRLRRFIEERTASADYSKHLSVVTLIRKDFEKLSELIEKRDPALPIDRIVLYVDDLDRCRPERVIEVLEAVHLLLAFRLFVVVVAVDPRWLTRCLELHYPQLLGGRVGDTVDAASPQDYLEKIFQIPFMVRPIDIDGYRALVRSLIPAATPQRTNPVPQTEAPTPLPVAIAAQTDASPAVPVSAPNEPAAARQMPVHVANAAHQILSDEELAIDPRRLELSEWERTGLEALAPLFTTPRSVKRFVNIYRLLRVSLWQTEIAAFDGGNGKPGDHSTVLLLLALVTNYPRLAAHLLQQAGSADLTTWQELVRRLTTATATAPEGLAPDDLRDWKVLCRRLSQLDAGKLPGPLAPSNTWKPRVVRYSFFVDQRS
jgi:KAP family P-loop domain